MFECSVCVRAQLRVARPKILDAFATGPCIFVAVSVRLGLVPFFVAPSVLFVPFYFQCAKLNVVETSFLAPGAVQQQVCSFVVLHTGL